MLGETAPNIPRGTRGDFSNVPELVLEVAGTKATKRKDKLTESFEC